MYFGQKWCEQTNFIVIKKMYVCVSDFLLMLAQAFKTAAG